jgi:predicted ester cyclase
VSDNREVVRGFIEDVLNRRDPASLNRYMDPDSIDRMNGATATLMVLAAFPDFQLSIELIICEGDNVGVLTTFTGSHQGTLMGIAPTGAGVSSRAAFCFRLANGRIVEIASEFEPWGLMPQLGLDPFSSVPQPTFG